VVRCSKVRNDAMSDAEHAKGVGRMGWDANAISISMIISERVVDGVR
jgi:hypothetical protein